jgi:hypothetical protein
MTAGTRRQRPLVAASVRSLMPCTDLHQMVAVLTA